MNKLLKRLDNYWYHYKWVTIISVFFVAVFVICVVQLATVEHFDIGVIYAGPAFVGENDEHSITDALSGLVKEDINDDGKKNICLYNINYMTDEQINQKNEEAQKDGMEFVYPESTRSTALAQIQNLLNGGNCVVCIVDKSVYDINMKNNGFLTLEYVLGYKPEYAVDDYSLYLKDTDFGKYNDCFAVLPDDTLLCVYMKSYISGMSDEEYEASIAFVKQLVSFEVVG